MYQENFCIKRIRELMEKNDFNVYRLAKKSGVSLSTLTSMFQKNTDPRVQTIEKICSACGISVAQFFERTSADMTEDQRDVLGAYASLPPHYQGNLKSYLDYLVLMSQKEEKHPGD